MKGIIFDMDNTLLRSRIDFEAMKMETYAFLVRHHRLPASLDLGMHTTSTLIAMAMEKEAMDDQLLQQLWEIPMKYEVAGMKEAELEPGIRDILIALKQRKIPLVVVTNNSIVAAKKALERNDIFTYFDNVIGRETVQALKPAPDAFLHVLNLYPDTQPDDWLSVGDAWIDGRASIDAGIPFLAYRGDAMKMKQMGVAPTGYLTEMKQLVNFL
ncbi:HAD family hydrolase [Marinicrinis sediminis]|uniref:HAD family hydrolase n=1 Tax=Marinicrinis sediminis TaxID=1652465 RepID=A0ABW5RGB0_9BACL